MKSWPGWQAGQTPDGAGFADLVRLIELALRTSAPRPVGQRMHADWLAGCMQTMMLGVRIAGLLLVETGRPGS